ncbi:cytosol nonspecific dipeptidase, partial [Streptococcus danieliae]|nr:cytosol nonspecific dipeptidase [Streptococcus danieliae]
IHQPLGNANRLLIRVLRSLEAFDARLLSYHGGTLRNAIPREAFAQVALPAEEIDAAVAVIGGLKATLQRELGSGDSGLEVTVERLTEVPAAEPLTLDASAMLIAALHAAPCGVERMSADVPGVVETSNNLGVL